MAVPLLHLVQELSKHKLVALKMANNSLAHIHTATSGYNFHPFDSYILSARSLMKQSYSQPKTPSTETTIVERRHNALLDYNIFSSSLFLADDRIAATCLCEYDGAPMTRVSNNATV